MSGVGEPPSVEQLSVSVSPSEQWRINHSRREHIPHNCDAK